MRFLNLQASLTTKLSLLVTLGVLLIVFSLGFYFDNFLRNSFLDNTQKRMQHGFERLASDLRDIETELSNGLDFAKSDEKLIASVELINHYQDKKNYKADSYNKCITSEGN